MATKEQLKEVIGKALGDSAFKAELMKNPVDAAQKMGFELSPEQAEMLKNMDISNMASQVEEMVSKGAVGPPF